MIRRVAFGTVLLALLAPIAAARAADRTFELSGIVKGPDGAPVAAAKVKAQRIGGLTGPIVLATPVPTDDGGRFVLPNLNEGMYLLAVTAEGLANARPLVLKLNRRTAKNPVEVVLERGTPLTGRVVDDNGAPIAHATVSASFPEGVDPAAEPAWTNGEGRFRLKAVASGPVDLIVLATGWPRTVLERTEERDDVTIKVAPGGDLEVIVVDTRGSRVRGVMLVVGPVEKAPKSVPTKTGSAMPEMTGADGTATFTDLAPGEYTVFVMARDEVRVPRVTVKSGEESTVTLRLP